MAGRLGFLQRIFSKAATASVSMFQWITGFGSSADEVGQANYPTAYAKCPFVTASIDVISQTAASVPIQMVDRAGESVEKSELGTLLAYVNAEDDPVRLILETAGWLMLTGNAYWMKLRVGKTCKAVQVIDASAVKMKSERGETFFELDDGSGRPQRFDRQEIVHFKTFNPTDRNYGMSPIRPLEDLINTWTWLAKHNLNYFKQGGIPAAILALEDERMTKEKRESMEASWDSAREKGRSAGRPMFMSGKDAKFFQVGTNPDNVTATELPKFIREVIHAVLGTPPGTVGILENANYSNMEEQKSNLWQGTIKPILALICGAVNSQLAPEFGVDNDGLPTVLMSFDLSQVEALQPDRQEMVETAARSVASGLETQNEARDRYLSRDKIEDPAADQLVLPMSLVPIGSLDAPAEQTPPQPPAKSVTRIVKRLTDQQKRAIYDGYNRERDRRVRRMQRSVGDWFQEIGDEVEANLRAHADEIAKAAGRPRAKTPNMDDLAFDDDAAASALQDLAVPEIEDAFQSSGQHGLNEVMGLDRGFELDTERFQKLLRERRLRLKTAVLNVQEEMRSLLAQGLAAGENLDALVARIQSYTTDAKRYKAERIARTETGTAMNRGALEGYRQGGAPGKEWLSIVDDRTREGHAELNGQVVPIDGKFRIVTTDGDVIEVESPHDPAMDAGDAANCRCTVGPAFEEDLAAAA